MGILGRFEKHYSKQVVELCEQEIERNGMTNPSEEEIQNTLSKIISKLLKTETKSTITANSRPRRRKIKSEDDCDCTGLSHRNDCPNWVLPY